MKSSKMRKRIASYKNDWTYINYFNQLRELALNRFEWKNLPDTVDERFLELTLVELGYAVYFRDETLGDLALTCVIGGELDVYRIPIYRRAYATNGFNWNLSKLDSVLIFNNYLHTPSIMTLELYAMRLYEIERALDTNVRNQKIPSIFVTSDTQRLSTENIIAQIDDNVPFIVVNDKFFNSIDVKKLETNLPYIGDKLEVLKHNIWNEALTYLGIENGNQDKRERLVSEEVNSNYGNVEAQRSVALNARRQAANQINKMFGTNIEVEFRSELPTMLNRPDLVSRETEFEEPEEGESE